MRLQTYILNEARKKVTFVRFGGLSKTNQKKHGLNPYNTTDDGFHKAPVKKGIYAFIWPYIEDFLFAWKYNDKESLDPESYDKLTSQEQEQEDKKANKRWKAWRSKNMKKFTYEGWLWCHFTNISPKYIRRRKNVWVEVHTSNWDQILRKQKHLDMKELANDTYTGMVLDIKDPYKYGLRGMMSKDHLEVFIEKVN